MAFQIAEQTGSRRSITLTGRAMPKPGVKWPTQQGHSKQFYPGNPVGTIHVLGAREGEATIEGVWRQKYIAGTVLVDGFPEVETVEQLIRIFESLSRSGNQLRVQWESFVRTGIMTEFVPMPSPTIYDVEWRADFSWSARDDQVVPRAIPDESPGPTLLDTMNAADDAQAFVPGEVDRSFLEELDASLDVMREETMAVFDQVRQAQAAIATPGRALGAIGSSVEQIRSEAQDEFGRLLNTPYETLSALDYVTDQLKIEVWRRDQAKSVFDHSANAQRSKRRFQRQVSPGAIDTIVVQGRTTLRDIAAKHYGSPTFWEQIANFNGLQGSLVEAGTVIALPQVQQQPGVRPDGNIQTGRAGSGPSAC